MGEVLLIAPPRLSTPFLWLYCPVRIAARLGEQIELFTHMFVNRIPSAASLSMTGVCTWSFNHDPYAPIAS